MINETQGPDNICECQGLKFITMNFGKHISVCQKCSPGKTIKEIEQETNVKIDFDDGRWGVYQLH